METIRNINKKYLLIPKILFFVTTLPYYTLHTFRGLFAEDKFGIKERNFGLGIGIISFTTFFTNIFFGTSNDKFGASKWFIITFISLSCLFFQLFYFDSVVGDSALFFWINMFFYLASNLTIPPFLDKTILEYLSKMPNIGSKTYGKQRLWGTVGYSVSVFLIEHTTKGSDGKSNFDNLKYYNLLVSALAVGCCFFLINWDTERRSRPRNDIFASYMELLKNSDYMFFLLIILLNGMTRASMTIYLTTYWKNVMKLESYDLDGWPSFLSFFANIFNKNPVSTASLFGMFLEVAILFKSGAIINKIGYFWPLILAQIAQLLRFLCYRLLNYEDSNAFMYVCLFELFKGLNFGLTHCSAVQLATKLCPPHLKATSQMIYQGTFTALGTILAGAAVGRIFNPDEMKDKESDVSMRADKFKTFFSVNTGFTFVTLVLFIYMYGIAENLLFNRENADKKLKMYEEKEKKASDEEKVEKKNLVVNK